MTGTLNQIRPLTVKNTNPAMPILVMKFGDCVPVLVVIFQFSLKNAPALTGAKS